MGKGRGGNAGFGGGMNMKQLQQLQMKAMKMQKEMEETQAALEEETVTASAGGGVVEITVSGKKELTAVKIDKEAVDPEDVEMLEEMIMAAANEALRKMDELSQERMAKVTGGLGGASGLF
ncbi:MAG: YbaB/EbfC family nucleoid-associated protein [Lachnospiraceae bacterium]|nr:YbaB/EbfC family nucleoid-associated protein [Lachnospiraceae bacterium]MBR3642025.1 YbaB/EbfC family nucleoid-associated protein [Parasporobacterium sp.]MBQ1285403.1 YbaB/EbfC family nucleoid-associated protein [Lachnospiraceae bacterium]MBR2842274.1 YbaB/EbfC family nucleoid-associated protein [Lachnospiraceae bacterium]MBR3262151.1 YbaB/EbfC family nucleoid-associated protein [Lachnospiraceae bacterium]